ncbi:MAG: family 10 glycosylhydrolase [Rhodothermales bacterium]|nr:family 10 glycosylhydrolase [Rhodothermales bacterium]
MLTRTMVAISIMVLLGSACKSGEQIVRTDTRSAPPEARALWVARMAYKTPEDVRAIMQNAAEFNFNIVLFQIRGNATAFYSSDLEPWAWELTGDDPSTLGTDPGWDPLQIACDEAHARGLELHAWVNVFPAWRETVAPPDSVDQLWNTNREWFMQNAAGDVMWPQDWWTYWYAFLDPGVPEVKQHLHDVFLEIVEDYPVDGLHYDYVRYPSEVGDWAYNPTSVERFAEHYKDYDDASPQKYPVQWSEWKRSQITDIVESVYLDAKKSRPDIFVSAAVIHDWPRGHNDYSQDAQRWLARGLLDGTTPMLYSYKPDKFAFVAREHLQHAYGRSVWPGLNPSRTTDEELLELIQVSRELGAGGVALFSYRGLFPDHEPGDKARLLRKGPFSESVAVRTQAQ